MVCLLPSLWGFTGYASGKCFASACCALVSTYFALQSAVMAISSSSCDSVAFGIETGPCISQICPNVTSQLPWWLNVYWCRTALLAYHTGLTVTSKMLLSLCGETRPQKTSISNNCFNYVFYIFMEPSQCWITCGSEIRVVFLLGS